MCMSPRRNYRDPEECYDVVFDEIPGKEDIRKIINHPRKLITVNLCANPYIARVEEEFYDRTCYEDEVE